MAGEYVEQRDGGYYVAGTRVMLDSIVRGFHDGSSPEAIREDFSTLSLEQVSGAIAFYLRNRPAVELAMRDRERVEDEFRGLDLPPLELKRKLGRAREQPPRVVRDRAAL